MADAPWRCSQCGTVNEPVANACRTCGRWPSLFELEGSTIEADAPPPRPPAPAAMDDEFAAETVAVEQFEPEIPEPVESGEGELPPEFGPADEDEERPGKSRWRVLARMIVPIGVAVYILITALADRG